MTRWGGCCRSYRSRLQLGRPGFVAFSPPLRPAPPQKGRRRPADWPLFCQLSQWEVCQSGCRAVRFSRWVSWNPAPVLRLSCNKERGAGGGAEPAVLLLSLSSANHIVDVRSAPSGQRGVKNRSGFFFLDSSQLEEKVSTNQRWFASYATQNL